MVEYDLIITCRSAYFSKSITYVFDSKENFVE